MTKSRELYEGITANRRIGNNTWRYSIKKNEETNQYDVYEEQEYVSYTTHDVEEETDLVGSFPYRGHADLLLYGLGKLLEENEPQTEEDLTKSRELYEGITVNRENYTWNYSIKQNEETKKYEVYEKQHYVSYETHDVEEDSTLVGTFPYRGHAELLVYGLGKLIQENEPQGEGSN